MVVRSPGDFLSWSWQKSQEPKSVAILQRAPLDDHVQVAPQHKLPAATNARPSVQHEAFPPPIVVPHPAAVHLTLLFCRQLVRQQGGAILGQEEPPLVAIDVRNRELLVPRVLQVLGCDVDLMQGSQESGLGRLVCYGCKKS